VHILLVIVLLSVFAAQSLLCTTTQSATYDEVGYIGIGKYLLKHHKWDIPGSILHPPLSFYLNSIPLLFVHTDDRIWNYDNYDPEYRSGSKRLELLGTQDIDRGQSLLSSAQNTDDRLLIASRLMTTLIAVVLGLYVYRFSCVLYGANSGLLSLLLYAFCPNMLAFSGLIVPDMPLTAFTFISTYYLYLSMNSEKTKLAVLSGVFLGLALLCKYSSLLLLPVTMLIVVASIVRNGITQRKIWGIALTCCIALLIVLGGYGFDLTPYLDGIAFQWNHAREGHLAFLMGEIRAGGWWYYYLLSAVIKTPIPLLLLFILAVAVLWRQNREKRFDLLILLVPIIIFMLFFSINHQSIGLRYILPIYPFLFVVTGSLATHCLKARLFLAVAMVWYISGSIAVAPHYLSYFNEIVGGPINGYKYLVDSNLDWGQDLKSLKKYMDKNGIRRIGLSYFGADSPKRYGIDYYELSDEGSLLAPVMDGNVQIPRKQLFAISATNLQGVYLDSRDQFAWLLNRKPIARVGYSIFIYD